MLCSRHNFSQFFSMSSPLSRTIKAIIFDIDNTLLASNAFVIEHLERTIMKMNQTGAWSLTMPTAEAIKSVQAQNKSFEEFFQLLFPGEKDGKALFELILEAYRADAMSWPIPSTTGALLAIQTLYEQGVFIGLVTNRTRFMQERLTQSGFNINQFLFMSSPASPEMKKPHPKSLDEAVSILQTRRIHPDEMVMVGDHSDDFFAAQSRQISFLAVLQGETSKEQFLSLGLPEICISPDLNDIDAKLVTVMLARTYQESLTRVSALDGRHAVISTPLRHMFSEYALHKYRVKAEIEHLIALSEFFHGQVIRLLLPEETKWLRDLFESFSVRDAFDVLQYDHLGRNGIGPTEHDVKSCELWIREKCTGTSLSDLIPFVHFFVTSEDINNLAYKSMLKEAIHEIFLPEVYQITDRLCALAESFVDAEVMGRTHLQPASPTTFGKIFSVYLSRLTDSLSRLDGTRLIGKINGAVGNYNSFFAAYPTLDWMGYSNELTRRFGFEVDLFIDQRGPHVDMIRVFQALQEVGNVLRDLASDLSLYCAFGTLYFSKVESHVGSSVMPHKINPWFAEVAEGNIKKANHLINCFSNELDVSRLQRDLSDHDFERSYGEAIGYILVAVKHLQIALSLIRPNVEYAKEELASHPEILTEALQTILRKHGNAGAYDLLKTAFRGKQTTLEEIKNFASTIPIADSAKQEIGVFLQGGNTIGLAKELTLAAARKYKEFRENATNVSVISETVRVVETVR